MPITAQILEAEQHLYEAIRNSDAEHLDYLLHDDLVYMSHDGTVLDKITDIELHRSGILKISNLIPRETFVSVIDGSSAVVTVDISLEGSFAEEPFKGNFRYLRVWKSFGEEWKVIAASAVEI